MKEGVFQQVGAPYRIYTRPANVFVATFIGHSNLFKGVLTTTDEGTFVKFKNGYEMQMDTLIEETRDKANVIIAVRPEEFAISDQGISATIKSKTFLGKYVNYELTFEEDMIVPGQPSIEYSQDIGHAKRTYEVGETITLAPNQSKINIFTDDGSQSLIKDVSAYE